MAFTFCKFRNVRALSIFKTKLEFECSSQKIFFSEKSVCEKTNRRGLLFFVAFRSGLFHKFTFIGFKIIKIPIGILLLK